MGLEEAILNFLISHAEKPRRYITKPTGVVMMISMKGGSETQGVSIMIMMRRTMWKIKNSRIFRLSIVKRKRIQNKSVVDEEAEILEEADWEDLFVEENMILRGLTNRLQTTMMTTRSSIVF